MKNAVHQMWIVLFAVTASVAANWCLAADIVVNLNGETVIASFNCGNPIVNNSYYVHGPGTFISSGRLYKNGDDNVVQFDGGAVVQLRSSSTTSGLITSDALNRYVTLSNCTIVSQFNEGTLLARNVGLYLADPVVGTTISTASASGKDITVKTNPSDGLQITGPGKLNIIGQSTSGMFNFDTQSTFDYTGETIVSNTSVDIYSVVPNSRFTAEQGGHVTLRGAVLPQGMVLKSGARLNINGNVTNPNLDFRAGSEFATDVKNSVPFVLTATDSKWPTAPHSVWMRMRSELKVGKHLVISGVGNTPAEVFYPQYCVWSSQRRITYTVQDGDLYAEVSSPNPMVIDLNGASTIGYLASSQTNPIDRSWEIHGPGVFSSETRLAAGKTDQSVTIDGGAEVRLTTSQGGPSGLIVGSDPKCRIDLGACTLVSRFDVETCLARNIKLNLTDGETGTTISTTSAAGVPITMQTMPASGTTVVMGSGNLNIAGEGTFRFDPQTAFTYTGTTTVKGKATAVLNTAVASSSFVVEAGGRLKAGVDAAAVGGLAFEAGGLLAVDLSSATAPMGIAAPAVTLPEAGTVLVEPNFISDPANGTYPLLTGLGTATVDQFALTSSVAGKKSLALELSDGTLKLRILDNDRFPAIATWTGAKDGNIADPANWACVNERGESVEGVTPLGSTSVRLAPGTTFNCPAGTPFACRELVVGGTTLGADCDWSGIDFSRIVTEGDGTIDLLGHNLTLLITEDLTRHMVVTDTSADGEGGELHVTVPEGKASFSNGKQEKWLELTGSLKLVKDGPGRFSVLGYNRYTGGTRIAAGELQTYNSSSTSSTYAFRDDSSHRWTHLGAFGSTITVDQGATLDIRGLYFFANYKLVLNGGTFASSGYYQTNDLNYQGVGDLTLTADSRCEITQRTNFRDFGTEMTYANLGGHTLTFDMTKGGASERHVSISHYGFTNGTVVVNGDLTNTEYGRFVSDTTQNDLRGCTLVLNCLLKLVQNMDIDNLTTRFVSGSAYNTETAFIYGIFRPESDYIHNFVMQDGSTIDLSAQDASWSASSALTGKTLGFAANARVTIDPGTRKLRNGEPVITWEAGKEPANIDTVRFRSAQAGFGFARKDNAIVAVKGLIILFR